jgi:putative polymerase
MSMTTKSAMYGTAAHAGTGAGIIGPALVLVAAIFNAGLCFVSTVAGIHFSSAVVILCEVTILVIGLFVIRARISEFTIRVTVVVVTMLVAMKFINAGLDLKLLHDLAITYIFYELGKLTPLRQGNRLAWLIMAIVLAQGGFEASMPLVYAKFFNIWNYYVDKGVLTSVVNYGNTTSFISGMRAGQEARSFFPSVLGPARFSSIFLEPVSMGNFSVIMFAWAISVRQSALWQNMFLILCAGICAILSDSRFAFVCWFLMIALRCTPLFRSRFALFCLPVAAMTMLLMAGSVHELPDIKPYIMSDDFPGRLLFSGRLLNYWGWQQWFGFAPSQIYVEDTGYAYAVNSLGLPLALGLLALFAAKIPATVEAASMKAMIAVYMATSLCIGANMFTIKTAALMWFLYGVAESASIFSRSRVAKSDANAHLMPRVASDVAGPVQAPVGT